MMVSRGSKTYRIIDQRIRSLVDDGYQVRVHSQVLAYEFFRLVHSYNGKRIVIRVWHHLNRMEQVTDNKITYSGTIQA